MKRMMRQERWRKLIKPENDVEGGLRQNKEGSEESGKRKEEKGKGPLVEALDGTSWHLHTDAHELNK